MATMRVLGICWDPIHISSQTSYMSSNPVYLSEIFNWRKINISTNLLVTCTTQHRFSYPESINSFIPHPCKVTI